MASALSHSRDFLAHSLARVRAGFGHLGAGEGPPIHVEPFDAHNASTSAGLVKLFTSVAAAHRAKANFAASQQDAELKREATRAQIAEIRSHAKYYEQGGAGHAPPATLGAPVTDPATGKVYPATTPTAAFNAERGLRGDAERTGRVGKVTAAQAALKGIDTQIEREAQAHAATAMARLEPYVAALTSDNPDLARRSASVIRDVTATTRTDVNDAAGKRIDQIGANGLDLSPYMTPATQDDSGKWTVTPLKNSEVVARQNVARAELQKALEARARAMLESRYGGQRASHQATIDEMARTGGAEPAPAAAAAPATAPSAGRIRVRGPGPQDVGTIDPSEANSLPPGWTVEPSGP